jgi:hypothetical protein
VVLLLFVRSCVSLKVFHIPHRRYVSPHRGALLANLKPGPLGKISRNRRYTGWVLVCASSIAQNLASSTLIGAGASEESPFTDTFWQRSIEISLRHLRHVFHVSCTIFTELSEQRTLWSLLSHITPAPSDRTRDAYSTISIWKSSGNIKRNVIFGRKRARASEGEQERRFSRARSEIIMHWKR